MTDPFEADPFANLEYEEISYSIWDQKEPGASLTGVYEGSDRRSFGEGEEPVQVHLLRTGTGLRYGLTGVGLDTFLVPDTIPVGTIVRVTYLGRKALSGGRSFGLWRVEKARSTPAQ